MNRLLTLRARPLSLSSPQWLRERYQVIILSDTFYEFGMPFMKKLGDPTLFCHKLTIDDDGVIQDFQMRLSDPKRKAISAFRMLNFTTCVTPRIRP